MGDSPRLWVVDATWRRLLAGAVRVGELDRRLAGWREPVAEARSRRTAAADVAWRSAVDERRRGHEAAMSAWEARQACEAVRVERARAAWGAEVGRLRRRLGAEWRRAARAGLPAMAVALSGLAAVHAAVVVVAVVALAVALVAGGRAGLLAARLVMLEAGDPAETRRDEPRPPAPVEVPPPPPEPEHPVALSIGAGWAWEIGVRRAPRPTFDHSQFGDQGEDAFFEQLADVLPGGYTAIRGLLVARHLDADLLLLGPTGIWLFEVKHWAGAIVCRDGRWSRVRKYYAAGGRLVVEDEPIPSFDAQWGRGAGAVEETVRRMVARHRYVPDLGGGLVFTVPDVVLDIDESCATRYGTPEWWLDQIAGAAPQTAFTARSQLAVLDALVTRAHRLDRTLAAAGNDAIDLAERLAAAAVRAAEEYVCRPAELAGGVR